MEEDLSRVGKFHGIVGYRLRAYDGGLNAFAYWETPQSGIHCPECRGAIDWRAVSTQARVSAKWEISSARGRLICGERFRQFCVRHGYDDVQFPILDRKRQLYELRPTRLLEVDIEKSQPLFTDFCPRCGNFKCYLHGRGLFLRYVSRPLPDGFYRTDIPFGCIMSKSPLVLVGPETMMKLKKANFARLKFAAVPFIDPGFEERKSNMDAVDRELRMRSRRRVPYTKI